MTGVSYLYFLPAKNKVLGRLKLKSTERSGIFYDRYLHDIRLDGGMILMSPGNFTPDPISLNQTQKPCSTDIPENTTLVMGVFQDVQSLEVNPSTGAAEKFKPYTIKIILWVETDEEAGGVIYDFQKSENKEKK